MNDIMKGLEKALNASEEIIAAATANISVPPAAFPVPDVVNKMMDRYYTNWTDTAELCVQTAVLLETAAKDLRDKADKMLAARYITDEVKGAVAFEVQARRRAKSLVDLFPPES